MKMIKKSKCEYKGGYIVNNGKVVNIDNEIVNLMNKLDVDVQRAKFEKANHCEPVEPVDEFIPKSEHGFMVPAIGVNTPELDAVTEKTFTIMDEIDAMNSANEANAYIEGIMPLFQFVNEEFIVSCKNGIQHRFDLPTVGNPLELTKEKLSDLVVSMFDLHL